MIDHLKQTALSAAADIRYRAIWIGIALVNFGAVIFSDGGLLNLMAGMLAAAWITYGWQRLADTNHRAEMVAHNEAQRERDIQWWTETALTSTGVNERKAAVDLLAAWRHPLHVNPLVEPPAPTGIRPNLQRMTSRTHGDIIADMIENWRASNSKPYATITTTPDQEK